MPDILRIKRRPATGLAGAPASLAAAEIAYNEKDDILYYGKGNNAGMAVNVIPIAGPGYSAGGGSDPTKVLKAGDTMTGPLVVNTATEPALIVQSLAAGTAAIAKITGNLYADLYLNDATKNSWLLRNQASDGNFLIYRFRQSDGVLLDSPFTIGKADGKVYVNLLAVGGNINLTGRMDFGYAASNPATGPSIRWTDGTYAQTLGLYVQNGINYQGNTLNPFFKVCVPTTDGTLGAEKFTVHGITGDTTISGQLAVLGTSVTVRGWNNDPTLGLIFFGNTGARYIHYDGGNYHLANAHVYSLAGRLWGTGDFTAPLPLSGGSMTGRITTMGSTGGINWDYHTFSIEVRGAGGANDAAYIAFHRPAAYAVMFGLDVDNQFAYGGWSAGGSRYRFWTEQNFNPASYAARGGDVSFRDITAARGDGSGVIFLGGGARYLFYNGTHYQLSGGAYNNRIASLQVSAVWDSIDRGAMISARGHDDSSGGLWCGGNNSGSITSNIRAGGGFESAIGSYGGMSDRRTKKNIAPASPKLKGVMGVEIIDFHFDASIEELKGFDAMGKQIGVADDNIASIWPGLVYAPNQPKQPNSHFNHIKLSVLYGPIMMKAFQEFVQETRERIRYLEGKLDGNVSL